MVQPPQPLPAEQRWVQAAVALGGNLGNSHAILKAAVVALTQDPKIILLAQSHWYQTVAVGPPQPDYLNACVSLRTQYPPFPFLQKLLRIEAEFGRLRQERWGPRTLDLDLLLFGNAIVNTPTLTLPHPHLHERAFVLAPLAEICPDWIHPLYQNSIVDLAKAVDYTGVRQLPD
ncbi:MAG: 2-amino-4-hydroxy-6-hydroxymethyldihydropteridine diphosphokinase [Acaryochloris sp. RU_4_1]|nr:2-amino-4-hydroxy-6-hydroxymethyldihydropteridine diphosphokinase [Acaryochloris sp. RU_4_1]NJR53322.1 2-amino-4-hydroxy-6-hydroxymethyldihydropteridine diphosphokinase [Acaryochloris sp. CRU_2_0]